MTVETQTPEENAENESDCSAVPRSQGDVVMLDKRDLRKTKKTIVMVSMTFIFVVVSQNNLKTKSPLHLPSSTLSIKLRRSSDKGMMLYTFNPACPSQWLDVIEL